MIRRIAPILFVLVLAIGCSGVRHTIQYEPESMHRAVTADGAHVSLIHLPPQGDPIDAPPLIFCHGLTSTAASWDLGDGIGLGPYLSRAGYDVWLLNLRGRGDSSKPGGQDNPIDYAWTFDDYARYDVPAAIAYVSERTSHRKVTWIGHSMGGMLIYAHLGSTGDSRVDKIVTIGSPVQFGSLGEDAIDIVKTGRKWFDPVTGVHAIRVEMVARTFTGPSILMRNGVARWISYPENFSRDTWMRYAANAIPNLSGPLMHQMSGWAIVDRFVSQDGAIDYRAGISRISVPALLMVGKGDQLASTWTVYPAYEALASVDKSLVVLGQANGSRYDHGHGGIILGNWADTEVYPIIEQWLAEHTSTDKMKEKP
jgi:poly[(R)-3-hydroxyalkanoate] polymerase subunit PhaC